MDDFYILAKENMFFFAAEFLLGVAGAWIINKYAFSLGFIDAPTGRSSHLIPTPKGGGVGILLAFVLGSFFLKLNFIFLLSISTISLLSFIGDRINLLPSVRLVVQFAAAFIVIYCFKDSPFYFKEFLEASGSLLLIGAGLLFATVFIVGTSNFYNFMDGINGIAVITGVVGFGLLAGYGLSCGKDYNYLVLCLGLAVSCLGFLPFNFPSAKVFMGDVGSILLGFVFAVTVLIFANSIIEFIILSSFLFPFYVDELVTMAERIWSRQSLTKPHRRHLYQILANELGVVHWKVSLGYGFFQLCVGFSIWQTSKLGLLMVLAILGGFTGFFVLVNVCCKSKLAANN